MKRDRNAFRRSWICAATLAIGFVAICATHAAAKESNVMAKSKTPELFDSGVPRGESDIVATLFKESQKRLREMVLNPKGTTQSSKDFRQARAAEQIHQVDRIIRSLDAGASAWIGKNVPAAYRAGKARGNQQAIDAGIRPKDGALQGSFSKIDQNTVIIFARDISQDLLKASGSMADRTKTLLRATADIGLTQSHINTILAGGVIEGQPVQTIRNLREELRSIHGDTVEITDRNGEAMNFKVGYYAEMVVRTKTREAVVKGQHARLAELDIDLVSIVGRVSNSFCTAFLGQVFSLSGDSKKYAAYDSLPGGGPPFHPNCSKSTRPFIEELASDTQLDRADGLGDAKKLLGMDQTKAQRAFQDLQLHAQQKDRYVTTEKALFG